MRNPLILSLSVLSLTMAGCGGGGDDVTRYDLKGKVTFKGAPVVFGEIMFYPKEGPPGSATIHDGEYDTTKGDGQGVVRGPHRVTITGYENELISSGDETVEDEGVNPPPLFVNYEIEADLSAETKDFDVPEDAANTLAPSSNTPASDEP